MAQAHAIEDDGLAFKDEPLGWHGGTRRCFAAKRVADAAVECGHSVRSGGTGFSRLEDIFDFFSARVFRDVDVVVAVVVV
ncbi:hypothetical protein [Limnohabitans sp.]|uniref:hypothetical protein n=1 Tax=Limnohabitans sp. TaxID=1907725 RepID=UPI0028967E7C|nr:hypothetical protein [Limnohabitans sp.]